MPTDSPDQAFTPYLTEEQTSLVCKAFTPDLTEEQTALVCKAFRCWNEDCFTDEDVAQTKAVFQHVFDTQAHLQGFLIEDALITQDRADKTNLYCMVVRQDSLEWIRLAFRVSNYEFCCVPRFELLLLVAMEYNDDPRDQEVQDYQI